MFNGCWFNFDTESTDDSVTYSPLFAYNNKLRVVSWSFRNIKAKGSLINLFGGNSAFDSSNLFSRQITKLLGCFYITSNDGDKVYFPIHNSMFR
jgi:hypothetical protein